MYLAGKTESLKNEETIGVLSLMLDWTTEPPMQAARYWTQREKNGEKWIRLNWCAAGYNYFDDNEFLTTHWLGPLPMPEAPKE